MSIEVELKSPLYDVTVTEGIPVLRPMSQLFLHDQTSELSRLRDMIAGKKVRDFVLDLGTCTYISSEGLGALAENWKQSAPGERPRLVLVISPDPDNELRNLLDITGLVRVPCATICHSVREAVAKTKEFPKA